MLKKWTNLLATATALLGSFVLLTITPIDLDKVNADAPLFDLIGSSDYGTCAASTATGGIACWGTPSFVNSVNVQMLQSVVVGDFHACALNTDGDAFCWGNNQFGQLGNGTVSGSISPVAVSGDHTFSRLAAGNNFTCGIRTDGATLCWGRNQTGQLGTTLADGATFSNIPVTVDTGEHFASLALGNSHACGLNSSGIIFCWGHDTGTMLGSSSGTGNTVGPRIVTSNEVFESIFAGRMSSCGLTAEGKAYCWGYNNYGQIGDGSTIDVAEPTAVAAPEGVEISFTALSIGLKHVCGISSGQTYCWGSNSAGQLGNERTLSMSSTPLLVEGPANMGVVAVAAGGNKTCFLNAEGVVSCFGDNAPSDHLGTGDALNSYITIPTQVQDRGTPMVIVGDISVGHGQAKVAGAFNPLGDGSSYTYVEYARDPMMQTDVRRVDFPGTYGGRTSISFDVKLHNLDEATTYYYRIVSGNRMGLTLGELRSFQTRHTPDQKIDVFGAYGCLLHEGQPYCWGSNNFGALGIGTVDPSFNYAHAATAVATDKTFVSISVGDGFACGIDSMQDLYCWGRNSHGDNGIGSLGIGSSVEYVPEPVKVLSESKFKEVDLGRFHGCALDTDGRAYCWGSDKWSQIGVGGADYSLTPFEIQDMPAFVDISASHDVTCGSGVDGDLYCWGYSSPSIQSLASAPEFESVAVGGGFTCGISTGELWCMHSAGNQTFQRFVGTYTRVVASGTRVCAVAHDGTWCWRRPVLVSANTWSYELDSHLSNLFEVSFDNAMCGIQSNGQYYCTENGTGSNNQHSTLRAIKFGEAPAITGGDVSRISTSESTINASFDSNWLQTTAAVEYSTSPDFSPSTIIEASSKINPEDTNLTKSWTLTELNPGTTYYYRLLAKNILGTVNSVNAEFRTAGNAPVINDVQSTNVGQNTARITASLLSGRLETNIQLEVSNSSEFQNPQRINGPSLAPGEIVEHIAIDISGLTESTIYYYRLTATNELGSTSSNIGTFVSRDPVGISINAGELNTTTQEVVVDVSWPLGATGVLLSNDGGFTDQVQFGLQEKVSWTLRAAGDYRQPRTVYLKFILADGSRTAPFIDDIVYDPVAPVISDTRASLQNINVMITTIANDNESGLHKIQVDAGDIVLEKDFTSQLTVSIGDLNVNQYGQKIRAMNAVALKVRVKDYAGNWSDWRSVPVTWQMQNSTLATPTTSMPVIRKSISQRKILKNAQVRVKSGSKVSLLVLGRSKKFCRVVGTSVRPLQSGVCKIKVTVQTPGGNSKKIVRSVIFQVDVKEIKEEM